MYNGYDFYFKINDELIVLPITPAKLTIKSGSNNKVVTLINEGDVNILKSPSLMEISFDARFPMRKYPFSRDPLLFEDYFEKFTWAKENKKPVNFSVVRATPNGKTTWGTSMLVSFEELETEEDAEEGDDVIVSFKLKQYKEYGIKTLSFNDYGIVRPTQPTRSTATKNTESQDYIVKSGDCLWSIAKKFYGDGSKWKVIYEANKTIIEETAKKHGKSSSSNGHWIYPGTKLKIPSLDSAVKSSQTTSSTTTKATTSGGNTTTNATSNTGTTGTPSTNGYVSTAMLRENANTSGNSYIQHLLTFSCNGINAFAGDCIIYYTQRGQSKSVSTKTTKSILVDKGSTIKIEVTPKKGCGFYVSNYTVGWSGVGSTGLGAKAHLSKQTLTFSNVRHNVNLTLKWVTALA